jgi:prepilin-type processing-associated H-X9-DG protein
MTQQPPLTDPDLAIDDSRIMVSPDAIGSWPKPKNTRRTLLIVGGIVGGGLVIVGIIVAILIPAIFGALDQAHHAQCAANLKQIGLASQAWASSHKQQFPNVFTKESTAWDQIGNTRFPKDDTDRTGEPINSNTANLWALAKAGLVENPSVFVCPKSGHKPDVSVRDVTMSPCRDFQSAANVSYSYQNTFQGGSKVVQENQGGYVLSTAASPNMAIMADANPQRTDVKKSAEDYLAEKPSYETSGWGKIDGIWDLNSPNHKFKGQNVLYLDGHVEWVAHPFAGQNYDNIWTAQVGNLVWDTTTKPGQSPDSTDVTTLEAYTNPKSYDGTSALKPGNRYDSFLVP